MTVRFVGLAVSSREPEFSHLEVDECLLLPRKIFTTSCMTRSREGVSVVRKETLLSNCLGLNEVIAVSYHLT